MSSVPLFEEQVPLTPRGFAETYKTLSADRERAAHVADLLEKNPKAVLESAFVLDERQRLALKGMSNKFVKQRIRVLIEQLRSDRPRMPGGDGLSEEEAELLEWLWWVCGGECGCAFMV